MLQNATIAELFMREAAEAEGHRQLAFRRAANAAFMWPEEAADVAAADRSLTTLPSIGPSLARRIHQWIESPPKIIAPPSSIIRFISACPNSSHAQSITKNG